jgi:hypothetical protein
MATNNGYSFRPDFDRVYTFLEMMDLLRLNSYRLSNYVAIHAKVYSAEGVCTFGKGNGFKFFEKNGVLDVEIISNLTKKQEPVTTTGKYSNMPEYEAVIEKYLPGVLDYWFGDSKPDEGDIAYSKAVKIAFDIATPDNIAKQFAAILSQAKECADEAEQPVTIFAKFKVKANGELTFDCHVEYNHKAKWIDLAKAMREYGTVSFPYFPATQKYNFQFNF